MYVTYEPHLEDVLGIVFRNVPVAESDEDKPAIILDHDEDGNIVGVQIFDPSKRVEDLHGVLYAESSA